MSRSFKFIILPIVFVCVCYIIMHVLFLYKPCIFANTFLVYYITIIYNAKFNNYCCINLIKTESIT